MNNPYAIAVDARPERVYTTVSVLVPIELVSETFASGGSELLIVIVLVVFEMVLITFTTVDTAMVVSAVKAVFDVASHLHPVGAEALIRQLF